MKKQLVIRKIHIEQFMDLLMSIYMDGAMFFDIVASPNADRDLIKVVVKDEYFEEYEEEEVEKEEALPLTDEIINALII